LIAARVHRVATRPCRQEAQETPAVSFDHLTASRTKKMENYALSVALHYMHYNSCRIHKTLRVTPAMASGVGDRLWSVEDLAALVEAAEAKRGKCGPYKKRGAAAGISK
jgi:hypothetical protein